MKLSVTARVNRVPSYLVHSTSKILGGYISDWHYVYETLVSVGSAQY